MAIVPELRVEAVVLEHLLVYLEQDAVRTDLARLSHFTECCQPLDAGERQPFLLRRGPPSLDVGRLVPGAVVGNPVLNLADAALIIGELLLMLVYPVVRYLEFPLGLHAITRTVRQEAEIFVVYPPEEGFDGFRLRIAHCSRSVIFR